MSSPTAVLSPDLEGLVQQMDEQRQKAKEAREARKSHNNSVRAAVFAVRLCTAEQLSAAFLPVQEGSAERLVSERWLPAAQAVAGFVTAEDLLRVPRPPGLLVEAAARLFGRLMREAPERSARGVAYDLSLLFDRTNAEPSDAFYFFEVLADWLKSYEYPRVLLDRPRLLPRANLGLRPEGMLLAGTTSADPNIHEIRRRLQGQAAEVALSVYEKLRGNPADWILRVDLKRLGFPPTSVDRDYLRDQLVNAKRGGGRNLDRVRYNKDYLLEYVVKRWKPRVRD